MTYTNMMQYDMTGTMLNQYIDVLALGGDRAEILENRVFEMQSLYQLNMPFRFSLGAEGRGEEVGVKDSKKYRPKDKKPSIAEHVLAGLAGLVASGSSSDKDKKK